MLSAIISDTLLYRSPTCTQADRIAGEGLARIAGVDPEELAKAVSYLGKMPDITVQIEAEYKEEPASAEIISAFVETSGAKVFVP